MKQFILFGFFMAAMFSSWQLLATEAGNKDVIGEWKYEVPSAPHGYEKGVMVLTEKEGKIAGEVKLADGYKIELKNIEYAGGVLKFGLYVDYEYISVTSKVEGKKMSGMVKTPEGDMKLSADKVK